MKKLSRLVQKTEENICQTEDKTEYDPALKSAISRSDRSQILTKDLLHNTKSIVGPRHSSQERNVLEELGHCMLEFGRKAEMASCRYGMCLIMVGETEGRIGRVSREYVQAVHTQYIEPMEVSLKLDAKSVEKEKSQLEKKRLDLDSCKKTQRKAKTNEKILSSTHKVKMAQAEFDRQTEILNMMLERLPQTHEKHKNYLKDMVKQQKSYYEKCHTMVLELYNELNEQKKKPSNTRYM